MDNPVVDQVKLAHPHALALHKLPDSLLADSVGTARLLVEGLAKKQILASSIGPDGNVPTSIPGWKSALDHAKASKKNSSVFLTLPPPISKSGTPAEVPKDDVVFPAEVQHLTKAFERLCHIERQLREVLHLGLSKQDPKYASTDKTIRPYLDDALQAQDDERKSLGEPTSAQILDYLDFAAVIDLILTNWKAVGSRFTRLDKSFLVNCKDSLTGLRNAVMHGRIVSQAQLREIEHLHHKLTKALATN